MKNEVEQVNQITTPKKKNLVPFILVGVVVVLLIGGVFLVKSLTRPAAPTPTQEEEITDLPPVDASVMVDLQAKPDGKAVVLSVKKIPANTNSIEYELSYTTDKDLPKGAIGKIELNGKTDIEREILLGTCSRNTCTYDTGVKSVNLVLRFNSTSGASQFTKEYSLE